VRILVAEDDGVTRKLLENMLTKFGHEVVACADGIEAWAVLSREDPPKMAILDWMMPGRDGIEVCRAIRRQEDQRYTYIILLTGKNSKADVLEGLEAGADDYLTKPFDPNELRVRIRTGARIVNLQEELISALRLSEFRATHDSLTGLLNRGALLESINKELARASRELRPLGIFIADVDHFKGINDQWGHQTGDVVLRELAELIRSSLRQYDVVGRYGGEEFVGALPGCDITEAAALAERLRIRITETPIATEGGPLFCTMSFGVTALDCWDEVDLDGLLRDADAALYRAKKAGRNRVETRDGEFG
jgi:diguanylate cyclase (GGDEF)-like protein